jgi:ABC-type transport system substrate-binding protein
VETSYWSRIVSSRWSRRRALGVAGGASAGALLLAACGGSKDSSGVTGDKSGLLVKPADTTRQAKRGGVIRDSRPTDFDTMFPFQSGMTNVSFFEMTYSRLFSLKPGLLKTSDNEVVPDLAESWEWSPDRLTLTAKLRPGTRFHNLPPINGREVTMDDVLYSWRTFSSIGSNRTIVVNATNPNAPVMSVTAPDNKTVVIKFKEPLVFVQEYLTSRAYWNIVPKESESESVLNLRSSMLGSGPFMVGDYRPSASITLKRNEAYWEKERPYVDSIEYPFVGEYSAAMAQFRRGTIFSYDVRQEDILQTKQEVPDLRMYQDDVSTQGTRMFFGWDSEAVRDKRVRQAFSMSIARDDWITAEYNTDRFESAGLPVDKRWNTSLQGIEELTGWWLDPKGKDFGPNARFYELNIAEAKKLLAAAGYSNGGPEITSNHFVTGEYGPDFPKFVELWEGMAVESGFKFKKNIIDRATFNRDIRDSNGNFSGISYKTGPPAPTGDPAGRLAFEFTQSGGLGFHGFDAAGKGDRSGDPYLEAELKKAVYEPDIEKRRTIVHDVQRYLADAQYCIRWPGGANSFSLVWPAVQNYRVWRPGTALGTLTNAMYWWIDSKEAPLSQT